MSINIEKAQREDHDWIVALRTAVAIGSANVIFGKPIESIILALASGTLDYAMRPHVRAFVKKHFKPKKQ